MKILQNKWTNYLLNVLGTGLIFAGVLYCLEYSFYRVMPAQFWLTYYDIKPTAPLFATPDQPKFQGHYKVSNRVEVEYLNILRCNKDETGFDRISQYRAEAFFTDKGEFTESWLYDAKTSVGVCYLETNITLELPYNIEKDKKIIGDSFIII